MSFPQQTAAAAVKSSAAGAGGIKRVVKVLDILEYLAKARRPVGVSEVARAVNFHVSTAHRLLRTLASRSASRVSRTSPGLSSTRRISAGVPEEGRFTVRVPRSREV